MVDNSDLYRNKLTTPDDAVARIPKRGKVSFGLGPSNPAALLGALAKKWNCQNTRPQPFRFTGLGAFSFPVRI